MKVLGRRKTRCACAKYNDLLLVPFLPWIIKHAHVDVAVARQEVVCQLHHQHVLHLPRNKNHVINIGFSLLKIAERKDEEDDEDEEEGKIKYPQALDGFGVGEVLMGLEPLAEHQVPDHHIGLGVGSVDTCQACHILKIVGICRVMVGRQKSSLSPELTKQLCSKKQNRRMVMYCHLKKLYTLFK